jgi:hypothetical protein
MTSAALGRWRNDRAARLDELIDAHTRIGGAGPGRRTETQQINWALILRLAGEFQGFCRELHDEAADHFAANSAGANLVLRQQLRTILTRDRSLDHGNAHAGSLGKDFGVFGLLLWANVATLDRHGPSRQTQLDRLNRARNAIAHDLRGELESLRSEGYPTTLRTVDRWRSALDGLATTMDTVVGSYLATLFRGPRPW